MVPGTGHFSYLNYTLFLGNAGFCGSYLGPCKDGVMNRTRQDHSKGLSASVKLLLVIRLLLQALAAIIEARTIKKVVEFNEQLVCRI